MDERDDRFKKERNFFETRVIELPNRGCAQWGLGPAASSSSIPDILYQDLPFQQAERIPIPATGAYPRRY